MSDQELDKKITDLETRVQIIEELIKPLKQLVAAVNSLETSIKNGHFCKWNSEIGSLKEFKGNQTLNTKYIFAVLDDHGKDINELSEILTEFKTGTEILQNIEDNQKSNEKHLKEERFRNRLTILVAIIVVLLSFVFNVILEYFRSNI